MGIPSRLSLLLGEPDEHIATDLLRAAAVRGIATTWCRDGVDTLVSVSTTQPDVLVIATRIPVIAAATVVEILRWRWTMRILVGSSTGDGECARRVLAAGATAIVARPYQLDAICPPGVGAEDWDVGPPVLVAGPITVDQQRRAARVNGREVHLAQRELELLSYLVRLRGRVATHEDIINTVWGHPTDTNNIAVHVKRLRDKLGDQRSHGQLIHTVRGVGYRLASALATRGQGTD